MKNKRKTALAVLLAASLTLSACGAPAGEQTTETPAYHAEVSPAAREIADEYFAGDRSSFAAWKDIDPSRIICSVSDPDPIPEFDITFGSFINEYMYYLIVYGITDDMSEEHYDDCKSYRVNIVNYLMFEKMYLYAAKHDYGITPETLTKEQLDEVRATADEVRSDWAANFYAAASAKLGEGASDEDITKLCNEVLDVILEKCGIGYDMFYEWELNTKIQELTLAEMLKASAVSEDDVAAELETLRAHAKEAAEKNIETYEMMPSYQSVYIPEGTRTARYAVVSFPAEALEAINSALEAGNNEEAERLIEEAYTPELRQRAAEVSAMLATGAELDEVQDDFRVVTDANILKNSASYDDAFVSALYGIAEKGGIAEPVVSRDGVYIIQYAGDAQVSDSEVGEIEKQIREYLKEKSETGIQVDAYNNWTGNYPYTVDCELLRIDESDVIQSESDNSGNVEFDIDDFDVNVIE